MHTRRYVTPTAPGIITNTVQNPAVAQPAIQSPGVQMPTIPTQRQSQNIPPWNNPEILNQPPPPASQQAFPTYFRPTVSVFPSSNKVADSIGIPLSVVVHPSQVAEIPQIDRKTQNPIRCTHPACRAYLSQFASITPDGSSFICPYCKKTNKPDPGILDQQKLSERLECQYPVYDMKVSQDFAQNKDAGPCFFFIIDLSMYAVSQGLTSQFLTSIKSSLSSLADTVNIGIMTMTTSISVYDLVDCSETVISDLNQPFGPDSAIAPLSECRSNAILLIDQLLSRYSSEVGSAEHCLVSAIHIAMNLLLLRGGIIVTAFSGIPTVGPRKLELRKPATTPEEEIALLNIVKNDAGKFFKDLSIQLNRRGVSVHMYCTPSPNLACDLATISNASGFTGGACHYYPTFDAIAMASMHASIYHTLTTKYMWDCSLRFRTSQGIEVDEQAYGNLLVRKQAVIVPVLRPSDSIAFQVKIHGTISECIYQLAVLWINDEREPVIRIFNFRSPVSGNEMEIKNSLDECALMAVYAKQACANIIKLGLEKATSTFRSSIAQLNSRRFPLQSMLYLAHSFLGSALLNSATASDTRLATLVATRAVSIVDLVLTLYPRLFVIDNDYNEALPLAVASLGYGGIFLFHTSKRIFIWLQANANPTVLQEIFGVASIEQATDLLPLTEQSPPSLQKAHAIRNQCFVLSARYLPTEVIFTGSPRQTIIQDLMVDDSKASGADFANFAKSFPTL